VVPGSTPARRGKCLSSSCRAHAIAAPDGPRACRLKARPPRKPAQHVLRLAICSSSRARSREACASRVSSSACVLGAPPRARAHRARRSAVQHRGRAAARRATAEASRRLRPADVAPRFSLGLLATMRVPTETRLFLLHMGAGRNPMQVMLQGSVSRSFQRFRGSAAPGGPGASAPAIACELADQVARRSRLASVALRRSSAS